MESSALSPQTDASTPSPPRIAWGGAGMVSTAQTKTKSSLPSTKTRDSSIFSNIQSEDLAEHLSKAEAIKAVSVFSQNQMLDELGSPLEVQLQEEECSAGCESVDVSNDLAIARALDYDFRVAHDFDIELRERQQNKNSSVNICYDKHRLLPSLDWDSTGHHPWQGITHDDIRTHDHMFPITSSSGKKKKYHKQDKVEKSAVSGLMDQRTSQYLLSMLNSAVLSSLGGIISTGKEAVVHHARGGRTEDGDLPENCVAKVFKQVTGEFRTREKYIKEDPRFTKRMAETNHFKNILLWCEKEMRNMKRLYSMDVPCPEPLYYSGNVIIMSLIGHGEPGQAIEAAPQLKTLFLSSSKWEDAYEQTIRIMEDMTNKCRLVHGDLSEFNLLYWNDKVHVIDFAQSMDLSHSDALKFLHRDCDNISNFFRKKGVRTVKTGLEILKHITKIDFKNSSDDTEAVDIVHSELHQWRSSSKHSSDGAYEFLWSAANGQKMAMRNAGKDASDDDEESGTRHKDDWINKKTDSSIIKGSGKKKKQRKNSKSDKTSASPPPPEEEGFCVVDPQDCLPSPGIISGERNSLKRGQRVRFSDTDTAADTEDYNGDADTDDVDAETTDTDFNAAEDCDTEGYHGDADDTDNYPSDHNNLSDKKDNTHSKSSPQIRTSASSRNQQQQLNSKRNHKKKNKKTSHKK